MIVGGQCGENGKPLNSVQLLSLPIQYCFADENGYSITMKNEEFSKKYNLKIKSTRAHTLVAHRRKKTISRSFLNTNKFVSGFFGADS